jgi:hypothetical protein
MTASQKPKLDSEISLRGIVIFVVALVLIVVVASVAMLFLTTSLRDRGIATDPPLPLLPEARAAHEPPGPRLQADPMREMDELRAAETAELSSYGWVDEAGGIASIPVDRAMALLAESAGSESATPEATESENTVPETAPTHDEGGH